MGNRNKITDTVDNPLTDEESEFYIPGKRQRATYIRKMLNSEKRNNPLFKRAKYIYVHKYTQAKYGFRLRGYRRVTRSYGIAVLTDDHKFYYSEYTSKHTAISGLTASNMARIFLDGYIIDHHTVITLDKSIGMSEPVRVFLYIVASSTLAKVRLRDSLAILKRILYTNPALVKIPEGRELSMYHRYKFVLAMKVRGWLDFLPKRVKAMLDDKNLPDRRKFLIISCVLGIIYMFRTRAGERKCALDDRYNISGETTLVEKLT